MMPIAADHSEIQCCPAPDCILCGSVGGFEHENLADKLFDVPGRWNLRRCPNSKCGMLWLDPRPRPEQLWKLYLTYWTHGADGPAAAVADAEVSQARQRALKRLAALVFPWRRSALLSDSRYLFDVPPGRLLDVGCGNGAFISGMAQRGWQATGLDFDEQAVAAARRHPNVTVLSGGLTEQAFADGQFDAITLSNVIEHVPDPKGTFQELERILAPGGRLVVITPNANSLGHKAFGRSWRGLEPPRHLFLFTQEALKSQAEAVGLTRNKVFSTVGAAADMFESSTLLRAPTGKPPPNVKRLAWQERAATLFNRPVGEWVVLLATKERTI